ncbi:hypothetical protein ACFYU8_14825 [Brevibacillus sp. NPDC003359]|uniref:hypothetical protein n=1 Tax=unclassified Brevibacillus TaxID=2684853 RepID=UPI0036CDB04D
MRKTCSICSVNKPITDFYNQKGGRYGKSAVCKVCLYKKNKESRERRQKNIKELPNNLTEEQTESILENFGYRCFLTGNEGIGLDHFVPLSWGSVVMKYGIGGTTYANMIPLYRSINSSKQSMNPFIWFERYGERHGVSIEKWNSAVQYIAEKHDMTSDEYKNRVNACYNEILALRWITRVNFRIESGESIHYVDIRNALKMNLNIPVVVEMLGSIETKNAFLDQPTIDLVNQLKARLEKSA